MAQALDSLNEAHLLPSLHKSYPNPGNSLHAGPALRQALTQGRPLEMRSVSEIHATLRRVAGWLPPSHTPAIMKSGADGCYSCRLYPSDVSAQCPGPGPKVRWTPGTLTSRAEQTQQSAVRAMASECRGGSREEHSGEQVSWWRLPLLFCRPGCP